MELWERLLAITDFEDGRGLGAEEFEQHLEPQKGKKMDFPKEHSPAKPCFKFNETDFRLQNSKIGK